MVQQTMLRLFLKQIFKRSGESDSQKSQSSSGTDKVGPEASGSEFPAKNQRSKRFLRCLVGWLTEKF